MKMKVNKKLKSVLIELFRYSLLAFVTYVLASIAYASPYDHVQSACVVAVIFMAIPILLPETRMGVFCTGTVMLFFASMFSCVAGSAFGMAESITDMAYTFVAIMPLVIMAGGAYLTYRSLVEF